MGGFTTIQLKDTSIENIAKHNAQLELMKVPKKYRFYSILDIIFEYESFKKGLGHFPEHMFPKAKIKSLKDFRKFWSPEALGEVFVPQMGMLTFDCYFGRTSEKAMRKIGKWVSGNIKDIKSVDGSFTTFMERGMTKTEQELIKKSGLKL